MLTVERLEEVARNGVLGGYAEVYGHRKVLLKLAMDCEQPYGHTLFSRISAQHGKKVQPITVDLEAQCRKCFSCKRRRSMRWQARAITEYHMAPRTVFGTITMSVTEQLRLDDLITLRLAKGRVDFNKLSQREIFAERTKQFGAEVTKYFKRVRKGDSTHAPELRYLLVAEVHDSDETSEEMRGRPHFHLLMHEQQAGQLVNGDPLEVLRTRERSGEYVHRWAWNKRYKKWDERVHVADDAFIRKNWTLGFTNFQWAQSAQAASYVCAYLTKSLMLRVRASEHYGDEEYWAAMALHHNQTPIGKAATTLPALALTPLATYREGGGGNPEKVSPRWPTAESVEPEGRGKGGCGGLPHAGRPQSRSFSASGLKKEEK